MKLETASKLVNNLINKDYIVDGKTFNISKIGWFFKGFNKSVRRLGLCTWSIEGKYISLSRKMTELRGEKEVRQTILHEIAHAIDFEIRGKSCHDIFWKNISRSIGYKGERTVKITNNIKLAIYKWVGICKEHGLLCGWTRKPNNDKICCKCEKPILIVPVTDVRVKKLN